MFVAVEQWCGFSEAHPPHLWGDVQRPKDGRRPWLNVYPCPGARSEVAADE